MTARCIAERRNLRPLLPDIDNASMAQVKTTPVPQKKRAPKKRNEKPKAIHAQQNAVVIDSASLMFRQLSGKEEKKAMPPEQWNRMVRAMKCHCHRRDGLLCTLKLCDIIDEMRSGVPVLRRRRRLASA